MTENQILVLGGFLFTLIALIIVLEAGRKPRSSSQSETE